MRVSITAMGTRKVRESKTAFHRPIVLSFLEADPGRSEPRTEFYDHSVAMDI
jgi:hypothetical protein